MNSPTYSKETDLIGKNFPRKKITGPGRFTGKSYQPFKKKIAILHKLRKLEKNEISEDILGGQSHANIQTKHYKKSCKTISHEYRNKVSN